VEQQRLDDENQAKRAVTVVLRLQEERTKKRAAFFVERKEKGGCCTLNETVCKQFFAKFPFIAITERLFRLETVVNST
jgi:hypothetical protein